MQCVDGPCRSFNPYIDDDMLLPEDRATIVTTTESIPLSDLQRDIDYRS